MLADLALPSGVELVRTTPTFTSESVPPGLLREHRVAVGVWGLLRVLDGSVVFVHEASGERRTVDRGQSQVIEPDTPHHVEPAPGSSFAVEFHR